MVRALRRVNIVWLSLWCAILSVSVEAFEGPYAAFVPMSDGLRIDIDLRWPDTEIPKQGWPAIILAHSRRGDKTKLATIGEYYANRGYVTLAYSCRGDGESKQGGDAGDTSAATRGRDVGELRRWLIGEFPGAELPEGVTVNPGKVGMTGASQGALNSWYGAIIGGGFAAIVPQCFALHTWEKGFVQNGSILFRLQRLKAAHPLLVANNAQMVQQVLAPNAVYDRIPSLQVPILTEVAMLDLWAPANAAIADYLAATSAPGRMIYIGTGGHETADTDEPYRDAYLRDAWFDYYLKEEGNGIDRAPRIHVSLLDSLEKVTFDSFPHPDERIETLFLGPNRMLGVEAPGNDGGADTFENRMGDYTPELALADEFEQERLMEHIPQDALHFQTPPLAADALVLGIPKVRLHVEGSARRFQVNVHLTDDAPEGEPRLISWATCVLDQGPGEIALDMSYTGRRVVKGHRIGLTITNLDVQILVPGEAAQLRHLPCFDAGETTVYHDGSRESSIALPVIEGSVH